MTSGSQPISYLQAPILSNMEKIQIFIHKHPTVVKIAEASVFVLGTDMLASIPFKMPLGTGLMISRAITGL